MEKSTSFVVVPASSRRGRDVEHVECGEHKKPKIESGESLELVGINDDCLEAIFKCLSVDDLINVAESCNRFIPAAVSVYHRYHRLKPVKFFLFCLTSSKKSMVEAFFRHFGHSATTLVLNASIDSTIIDIDIITTDIEQFIQPDRLPSLVELKLFNLDETHFETFHGPFPLVQKVTIIDTELSEKLAQLNHWFPNMNTLKLYDVTTERLHSLRVHLPKLKHLTIRKSKELEIPNLIIKEMLRLNPQLESLELTGNVYELLSSMKECSKQLKYLNLYIWDVPLCVHGRPIFFEKVEKFTWTVNCYEFLSFKFKNLRELHLKKCGGWENYLGLGAELLDFLGHNKNLIKLSLDVWKHIGLNDVSMAIRPLSNLVVLQLFAVELEADELIQFMTKHTRLKTVQLAFTQPDNYRTVRGAIKSLESKWTISTRKDRLYHCIDFERK